MTQNNMDAFKQELSELYVRINKNEFTFPEFDGQTKKNKKENSLKALSIVQRYTRKLEQDEDPDDQRQTS